MEGVSTRPDDDQHTEETNANSGPAAPADLLAQHRHRKRADQQRNGKGDGAGDGKRQILHGEEIAGGGAKKCQRTQALQPDAAGADQCGAVARQVNGGHHQQMDEVAQEYDLDE